MNKEKAKHRKKEKKGKSRKIIIAILTLILVISIAYITYYFYNQHKEKQDNQDILDNIEIDISQVTEKTTERMLQIRELQKENEEVIGWLEIEGTKINFPVLQGTDNEYYMKHTYKKEFSNDGSIFLDKDYKWEPPSSNLLIYGHNNKNGNMFQDLLKYQEESYYKEHPFIRFTTEKSDDTYEIISAFNSRVYYKSEQNVFRYYYFVNAETEEEYNEFVNNCKSSSIYDTGKTATYGKQLLTLSTCEYSQEDGRFAVVARKVTE